MSVQVASFKAKVNEILGRYGHDSSMLVSILQDVQKEYNYLPREALVEVSHQLKVPMTQVYSVATFFRAFNLQPRGRHIISVCLGTACHVRGGTRVLERLELELGIKRGETTPDLKFTVEPVNCVGACALGPNIIVDGEYYGQMTAEKVKPLIEKYN
ncbi:MAG: NADH-quinone oxidoreductase subunit NuoE [Dehalococcoidales bacterium]|nr:NADH-quinone oxidoreductase subunit NuoE [Dehalococcoidales bacterium]